MCATHHFLLTWALPIANCGLFTAARVPYGPTAGLFSHSSASYAFRPGPWESPLRAASDALIVSARVPGLMMVTLTPDRSSLLLSVLFVVSQYSVRSQIWRHPPQSSPATVFFVFAGSTLHSSASKRKMRGVDLHSRSTLTLVRSSPVADSPLQATPLSPLATDCHH